MSPRPAAEAERIAAWTGGALGAELVVALAPLRIDQCLVRDGDLFELGLGTRMVGIGVGMQFTRQAAVGPLDLIGRRGPRHTEELVVVGRPRQPSLSRRPSRFDTTATAASAWE